MQAEHKICYGKCGWCVWQNNGGCSEWQLTKYSPSCKIKEVFYEEEYGNEDQSCRPNP